MDFLNRLKKSLEWIKSFQLYMLPEKNERRVILEGERSPDIFESLPAHAAHALFLPNVSAKMMGKPVTKIDQDHFDPDHPYSIYNNAPKELSLFERLTVGLRFRYLADAQKFHEGLAKVMGKDNGDPLIETYRMALNRDDPVGPMNPASVLQTQRCLQEYLISQDLTRSYYRADELPELIKKLEKSVSDFPTHANRTGKTGTYNSILLSPRFEMAGVAGEIFRDSLKEWPSRPNTQDFILAHPDFKALAPDIFDHYHHPDLNQVNLETQERLRGLSEFITGQYPHGILQDIAENLKTAVELFPDQVADGSASSILDLEYLLRSTTFWQDWQAKGRPLCSPEIVAAGPPLLEIQNGICPSLAVLKNNERPAIIVPQTIRLDKDAPIFVLAGGNDRGKSTTLRLAGQTLTMGSQGQFVTAESSRLSPISRLVIGMRVAREPERGSSHRQEMQSLKENFFDQIEAGNKSVVLLLDDFGQRTSSKDSIAILCSVLKYCQDRGILTLVASNVNSATKHFGEYGIKAQVYSHDENHQLKEGVEKSGAIEVAEEAGIEREIIDIAKQLQAQEGNESIHLELPDIPQKEKTQDHPEFATDMETLDDLGLDRFLGTLYLSSSPFHQIARYRHDNVTNHELDKLTSKAFSGLFSGPITEDQRAQRMKTIHTLMSENNLLGNLYHRLSYSLSNDNFYYPLGFSNTLNELDSPWIPKSYDFDSLFSAFYQQDLSLYREQSTSLRFLADEVLKNEDLSALRQDAQRIVNFLDSGFMIDLRKLAASHPEVTPKSKLLAAAKRTQEKIRPLHWKKQWVNLCENHKQEINEFAQSIGNISAYVTLTRLLQGLPFTETGETRKPEENLVEGGLNPFLLFSIIRNHENRGEWHNEFVVNLSEISQKLRDEISAGSADAVYDLASRIEKKHPELEHIWRNIRQQSSNMFYHAVYATLKDLFGEDYLAHEDKFMASLGIDRSFRPNYVPQEPDLESQEVKSFLEKFLVLLKEEYPQVASLSPDDIKLYVLGGEKWKSDLDRPQIRYDFLKKLYPDDCPEDIDRASDLPKYFGYAKTSQERMRKFLDFMIDKYPDLKDLQLVNTPGFIEEAQAAVFIGPNEGGKTQFLFKDAIDIIIGEQVGRVLGTAGCRQKQEFTLSALHAGYDTHTQGSLHSELANRIKPLIDRYKILGEPSGGVIFIDEPVSPWTSHEEAKYLIVAIVKYFERRGVKVRMTTHCLEALDLLEKLDQESKVDYIVASAASRSSDEKYQIKQGPDASLGIEIAEEAGWPPEVIADAER